VGMRLATLRHPEVVVKAPRRGVLQVAESRGGEPYRAAPSGTAPSGTAPTARIRSG
jgi:hypothetical protein